MITPRSDTELLSAYAKLGEEQAFREFVQRHAAWVLGVARRRAGNDTLGEDIAQNVFCLTAQKAAALASRKVVVSAWLHRTTVLTSANAVRREARHRKRLAQAATINPSLTMSQNEASLYGEILPHLDEALDALSAGDRELLLQRYFQERSIRQIATQANLTEAACQKRVSRAVEKLGDVLRRKRIAITSGILTSFLSSALTSPASASLVTNFTDTALLAPPGKAALATYATAAPITGAAFTVALAAAALLAFALPIGLQLQENAAIERLENERAAHLAAEARSAPKTIDLDLAKLSADLASLKPGDTEALLEVTLFASRFPLEKMHRAWEILQRYPLLTIAVSISDHDPSDPARALLERWAELDLSGVIELARATQNPAVAAQIWHGIGQAWSVKNPADCFDALETYGGEMDFPEAWRNEVRLAIQCWLADTRPLISLAYINSLHQDPNLINVTYRAITALGRSDPLAAVNYLKAHFQNEELDDKMHQLAQGLYQSTPLSAMAVARLQENEIFRERDFRSALDWLMPSQPQGALDYTLNLESTPWREELLQEGFSKWLHNDSITALIWLEHTSKLTASQKKQLAP